MADTPTQQPTPAPEPAPSISSDKIHLTVRNRKRILFNEDVRAVTSHNDSGRFDILPQHSNFISVINQGITIHKLDGQEQTIPVANGVIKVKDSTIHCYIDLLTIEPKKKVPTA